MKKLDKKSIPVFILVFLIFLISYLWRKEREFDIKQNGKYTFGRITKQLTSLRNGKQWYYEFKYKGKNYEYYRSTHIGYDVNIGDYFLVQFSSHNPEHSKIFYEYELNADMISHKNYISDTIPTSIITFHQKKNRIW